MFVTEPFSFDEEYERALKKPLHGSLEVRFVTIATLIRMKEPARRTQDLIDIENLKIRIGDDAGRS
jgi:flagellar assembly factor FliW